MGAGSGRCREHFKVKGAEQGANRRPAGEAEVGQWGLGLGHPPPQAQASGTPGAKKTQGSPGVRARGCPLSVGL